MNGIRFIAAFSVIFHHIEQSKFWVNLPGLWTTVFIDNVGHKGRIIFFVLSGFLITYLFLSEINKTGTLKVKNFHIRRFYRVWPVYIFAILLGFFVLPLFNDLTLYNHWRSEPTQFNDLLAVSFWEKLFLYMLMFPNFARFIWSPIAGLTQMWSIGVQEQFYLIWPTLTRISKRYFLKVVVGFILLKVFVEVVFRFYLYNWDVIQLPYISHAQLDSLIKFWEVFAVEQLALGALLAYIFFEKKTGILNFIYNKYLNIFIGIIYIFLFFVHVDFYFHGLVEGIIAGILLINISTNPKYPVKLEHPTLNYLGNISYGIYLFHNFFIILTLNLLFKLSLTDNLLVFNTLLYSITIIATLLMSALSFKYVEMYFFQLKSKFEVIKSSRKMKWSGSDD